MTSGNRVPSYQRQIADLQAENRRLWLALGDRPSPPAPQEGITFSWSGATAGTRTSGPYWTPSVLTLVSGTAGCGGTGPAPTTINLVVDGVFRHTFTLPANSFRSSELFRYPCTYAQSVALNVVSGGCSDFTFTVGFVREVTGP